MTSAPRAVLLGASGFTGRLVAEELVRLGAPPFLLVGRNAPELESLATMLAGASGERWPVATVDVTDPDNLALTLRDKSVVVNCVGPFSSLGEPVVGAAIAAGCHYLDITGEQGFIRRIQERFGSSAKRAGVTVVNAMAFEYALGACAATLLAETAEFEVRRLDVTYSWRVGWKGASAGTRRSILGVLGGGPAFAYEGRQWHTDRIGRRTATVHLGPNLRRVAVNFPSGEVVSLPRHLEVETIRGWLAVGARAAYALRLFGGVLPGVVHTATPFVDSLISRGPRGPDSRTRNRSEFLLVIEATGADFEKRRLLVAGRDPYGLTGAIAARGALRCLGLADGSGRLDPNATIPPTAGVIDAAQLMDPRGFLGTLAEHGVECVGLNDGRT
jgi:short subunit dehydrogenase-like uncharacterized protein